MKQITLIKIATALLFIAIVALAYRYVHPAFLIIVAVLTLVFSFWLARRMVDYFYYTARKRKKRYFLSKQEYDFWQRFSKSNVPLYLQAELLNLIGDRYDLVHGSAQVEQDEIVGYPVNPFD